MATGGHAVFLPEAALGRRELLSQPTRTLCGLREEGPHKGLFVSIKEVVWSLISKVPCTPHALGRQRTLLLYGRAPLCYPTWSRLGPGGQSSRRTSLAGALPAEMEPLSSHSLGRSSFSCFSICDEYGQTLVPSIVPS